MKLSAGQQRRFWREWAEACRVAGWTEENGYGKTEREGLRKLLLERAGFSSLTEVSRVEGFDRVLRELAALNRPDDLDAQMAIIENGCRVLRYSILHGPMGDYWKGIAADRFRGKIGENPTGDDLAKLSERELRQLRDTVCARACGRSYPF